MTVLRAAAETHPGYVRSTNQDLALVTGDLVAVADGMGGHLGGEVAARTAIEELLNAFVRDRSGDGFVRAARRANRGVWRKSRVDRTLHGMGTTLTALALVESEAVADGPAAGGGRPLRLVLLNVGDSRAYLLEAATHQFRQLTEDHSVVEEMVRQGELTPEEAAVHPHRHVLTRALGIEAELALDIWELPVEVGDRFLLCSDGLTNELPDAEIADILARAADPEAAVADLVGRALGHGGMDNVTVVVADIAEGDEDPEEVPVQFVPAGAPLPEDPVQGTPELTEAIPVTQPGEGAPEDVADPGAGDPPSGRAEAGDAAAAGVPLPAGGVAGGAAAGGESGGVGAAGASGGVAAAGASMAASAAAGAALAAGRLAGARIRDTGNASGPDTQATSLVDGADPIPDGAVEPRHRSGRSMTVRQRRPRPSIDGTIGVGGTSRRRGGLSAEGSDFEGASGPPSRPVVLVPQHRRAKATRDRIVTVRVALFIVVLGGLLAGTVGTVIWYAQSSYFVGLNGDAVAIYQGRPGGMLWFKPQLVETSQIRTSELLRSSIDTLRGGITETSLKAAEDVIARLKNEKRNALDATTTTTTTTSPTTTLPPTTTYPTTIPQSTVPTTTRPAPTTSTPTTTSLPTSTTRPGGGTGTTTTTIAKTHAVSAA